MKGLGTGFGEGIGFLDIEVLTMPSGQPTVKLHGNAAARAAELGIVIWLISTSHEAGFAIASVIGLGNAADL